MKSPKYKVIIKSNLGERLASTWSNKKDAQRHVSILYNHAKAHKQAWKLQYVDDMVTLLIVDANSNVTINKKSVYL